LASRNSTSLSPGLRLPDLMARLITSAIRCLSVTVLIGGVSMFIIARFRDASRCQWRIAEPPARLPKACAAAPPESGSAATVLPEPQK
jgi:hypothetical protein